ncbi:T9SS type A sorting domain-containing protein, partial [Psychroflexus planctonicus]|uniref:T9SS type A sorting domain-containing protein n=1 Tax=Psychroflexus planctonicus TaxID=1526575 RepID=UPI0016633A44
NTGFFDILAGEVNNLKFDNSDFDGQMTNAGVLAGQTTTGANVLKVYVLAGNSLSSTANPANVGGLVGLMNGGTLSQSYANASLTNTQGLTGGFIGEMTAGNVNNSYSRATLNVENANAGGFVGEISAGSIDKTYAISNLNLVNAGTGTLNAFGNQTGANLITNSFYDSDVTSTDNSDATGETTANMTQESIFITASWDFVCENTNGTEDIWRIAASTNNNYPFFNDEINEPVFQPDGSGTETDPYQITSLANLIWIAQNPTEWSAFYIQLNNIDVSETLDFSCPNEEEFQIIAQGELESFSGNYDGQNFSIENLTLNNTDDRIAFFGTLDNANISNLNFANATVTGNSNVGVLAGIITNNSNIENISIQGSVTQNEELNLENIGGLAGAIGDSNLSDITIDINITSEGIQTGGVAGSVNNSTLINLNIAGSIAGNNLTGGIVGIGENNTSIENASVTGTISGADFVGGIVGSADSTNLSENANEASVTGTDQVGGIAGNLSGSNQNIVSQTSTANIIGNTNVGGLYGEITASVVLEELAIENINITGENNVGGLIGSSGANVTINQSFVANITFDGNSGNNVGGFIGVNNGSISVSFVKNFSMVYSTSLANAGGFTGEMTSGTLTDSYVLSTSTTTNSFSNIGVSNTAGFVGNAVGGSISRAYAAVNSDVNGFSGTGTGTTISNSFYDQDLAEGNTDTSATATTTANMNLEATFTAAGWDFECETTNGTDFIWGINTTDNQSYAFLRWEGFESECIFDANWIGVTSSDWADASNWADNVVPGVDEDISIPATVPNFPLLDQDRSIQSLFVEDGASLSIGENNTLTLKGNIIGQGTIIGGMNSSLLVDGDGEVTLQMNQDTPEVSNMLFNLTLQGGVNNERALILNNPVFVNNVLNITTPTTRLQSDLNLTLYCDFNSSNLKVAQVDQQLGTISGGLVAEQCFPARRAYRFVAPSLDMLGSIQDNWQEGASSHNDNSVPAGYGTHITGNGYESGTPTLNQENNGFDWNPTGNPSMFTFFSTTQNWAPANQTTNSLGARDARRLMVRGDRTINITQNEAVPTNTKLRTRGTPDKNNISIAFDNNYAEGDLILTGNPFWAQVDIESIINNEASLLNYFYYWDPSLGGTPTPGEPGGRGAWVAYLTGNFGEETAGTVFEYNLNGEASSSTSSQVSNIIQPMQAIMLVASGGSVNINYNQSDKAIESTQVQIFSEENESKKRMDVNLFKQNDASSPLDAYRVVFIEGANNSIGAGDIPKLDNIDENLSSMQNGQLLTIQLRDLPLPNEDVNMFINNYKHTAYRLQIDIDSFDDVDAYLLDLYTNEEIILNEGENNYTFNVDPNINPSTAFNRFKIEFRETNLSIIDNEITEVNIYPNPVDHQFNLVLPHKASNYTFTIYDLLGNPISNTEFNAVEDNNTISVTNFNEPAGVYFIKIDDGKQTITTLKFIKK